jgi:hypothetical protein
MTLFKKPLAKKDLARIGLPVVALALVASVVVGRERPAGPVVDAAPRAQQRIAAEDLDLSKLFRTEEEQENRPAVDPFARRSFAPQQQAADAPASPAKRAAPPLPFRYVGKAIEDGKLAVFLQRGEDSYSVQRGQKLDNEYRVDQVSETKVVFTYLPLKAKQTLDIPAVN